ncbi:hypothetical protein Tco_0459499 [Tanacetum coccineum]
MAQSCFMKAEDKYFERVTEVHHLRAIAVNARTSYTEMRKLFEDAAKLFYYISKSWPIRDRIIKQQCGTVYQVVKRFKCIVRIIDESCTAPLVVFDTNISKLCGKFIWEITDKHPGEDTDKIILGVAEKAKANGAKKMVQVTAKKSYAKVREELEECLTRNKLTRKELFRACFSKDT